MGDISALCYFWTKRCKTIPDLLYLAISATDVISVSLFPLSTISLVNDRKRMLFNNEGFCTAWSSIITFTARMSMFLAMMICITRTIAMKYPFFHIKRSWLIGAISGYAGYMIVFYLIYLPQKWHYGGYSYELSSCLLVTLNFRCLFWSSFFCFRTPSAISGHFCVLFCRYVGFNGAASC